VFLPSGEVIELAAPTFAVIPEPGTLVLMLSGLLGLLAVHRHKIVRAGRISS